MPSTGLTSEQLQGVFSTLGIPAFFYDLDDLPRLPADPDPPEAERDEDEQALLQRHQQRIVRERLLRVVCKYLNSGFPVIVLTGKGPAHAYTLVGWQEHEDGSIALVACDDQVGPYEMISDPFAQGSDSHRARPKSLMIPLPEKVFLTGEAAETDAFGRIELAGAAHSGLDEDELSAAQADGPEPEVEGDEAIAHDVTRIRIGLNKWHGPVSVRTRLMEGRRYKALLKGQDRSPAVMRLLRLAHLPHWIWLVEFHDRAARERGEPCVFAEVVFDSTSHDDVPMVDLLATRWMATDSGRRRAAAASDDAGRRRAEAASDDSIVDGDGLMWRSMITDPEIIDGEYVIVPRGDDDAVSEAAVEAA